MTIYHINKAIGLKSSGIEYAQKYRFDLVRDFPEKQYFVYCEYIYMNYTFFTDNIGIEMDNTLNAYKFLARQKNHRSTYRVEDFEKTLSKGFTRVEDGKQAVDFVKEEVHYKVWLLPDLGTVDRIDTIINNSLQEVAHYSDRLTNIDYYSGTEVFCRFFFDEAGELSMKQFVKGDQIILTLLDNLVLQGLSEFYDEFFRRLNFDKGDIVFLDRNTDFGMEMLMNKNASTFIVVVHAEHFAKESTEKDWILWNNYYEYVFVNHQYIDYYIVSTDKQKERLKEQFRISGYPESKIVTIPVGSIGQLSSGKNIEKNKYKFLTASRLAGEKHIDVLIRAVVEAKKELPELEFHIYGDGGLMKNLSDLIEQLDAKDYIFMEGHKHLEKEYEKYGGYLTASGSEGFGLTILEAVASCLPIIGLKVDYGNTEFIKEGVNGYLLKRESERKQVHQFAQAILKMTEKLDYQKAISYSHQKAEPYLSSAVSQRWRELYDECLSGKGDDE